MAKKENPADPRLISRIVKVVYEFEMLNSKWRNSTTEFDKFQITDTYSILGGKSYYLENREIKQIAWGGPSYGPWTESSGFPVKKNSIQKKLIKALEKYKLTI